MDTKQRLFLTKYILAKYILANVVLVMRIISGRNNYVYRKRTKKEHSL